MPEMIEISKLCNKLRYTQHSVSHVLALDLSLKSCLPIMVNNIISNHASTACNLGKYGKLNIK